MKIIYQHRIYRTDLQKNPDIVYVFGDNTLRQGLGGQAREMRYEPNALGIATLRAPGDPWTDDDYDSNCQIIDVDLRALYDRKADVIVFPSDGIGTGLAYMKESAPRTFHYLCKELYLRFGIQNGT